MDQWKSKRLDASGWQVEGPMKVKVMHGLTFSKSVADLLATEMERAWQMGYLAGAEAAVERASNQYME